MHRASLNHTYRLVWSDVENAYVAVAENVKGRGKKSRAGCALSAITCIAACALFTGASGPLGAQILPTDGSVVAGSGSITTSGSTMTVTQTSANMAANWQSFNIGHGSTVNFVQPSASSVALNRVLGADVSVIQGALTANGQVFLINPNGVMFTPTAQVNVGGMVASTLNLSTADFMAGNYQFEGASSNAIVNQGNITAHGDGTQGGTIALIAAKVTNNGNLTAQGGNVLLGAGSQVTLDLGGRVKLQVAQAAIDALIEQGGAIKADGGLVYLTAKVAGDLASTAINHTGSIEARTLATGEKGEIYLLGDMVNDSIVVGGTLDASAPQGGDGGFIETSAAQVNIQSDIQVTTASTAGTTGHWLIDPVDITIAASGGNITGSTIATALQSTNVTLDTAGSGTCTGAACSGLGGANGDIFVKDNIAVTGGSANTTLTLKANRNIFMDAGKSISRTGSYKLDTVFWANSDATGGGAIWLGKGNAVSSSSDVTISTNGGNITLSGGSDVTTGYAEGVNGVIGNGVTLDRAQLLSAGGNIVIRGKSSTTATNIASTDDAVSTNTDGIRLHGGNTINAGSGTISLTGVAQGNDGSSNAIETNYVGYTKVLSSSTSANAISFIGDATAGLSPNGWGTFLWGTNTSGILLAATGAGGGINLDGYGSNIATGGGGTHLEPNAFVLAASGPIAISGTKGAASTYEGVVINSTVGFAAALPAGFGIASPVTASSSDISITTDTLSANRVFGGGTFSGSAVQSTGTLTIAPRTNGKALSVQTTNPGGTGLWINPTSMFGASGLFKTGFTKLVFGSSTTGDVALNNYTFDNDTELNTSGNAVLGSVAIATKALTVNMTGSGTITNTGAVAVAKLNLNGSTSATTLTNAGNAIGTLAANVASLSLVNSSALNIGTVGATSGVTATGTIDIATLSGDLTVSQNVATTNTSAAAMVLNAGKNTAAGTSTGGNIVLSGAPTITVGAGGRATLMTGAVGNAALTTLVGSGSGHFRYNSDESATHYTAALGTGTYAIYREKPIFSVTPSAASSLYGDAPSVSGVTGSVTSAYVNGDTTSTTTGTASFTTTALSTSSVGSYDIAYSSGLTNSLGYGYADAAASTAEYTISQRPITVTADNKNKVYGSSDPALTYAVTSGSLVNGDALTGALTRSAGENVGNYTISASALANGNYLITANNGALTIDPRPITVTADNSSKTYGNADPALTYAVTSGSLVNGDALTGALTRSAGENVGNYTISASALTNGNYLITANNGTLTIDPRPITVTADNKNKVYGSSDPALTYAVTSGSLVTGDTLAGALTRSAGESVGNYTISASALANGNYLITANNGTLTIDPLQSPIQAALDSAQNLALAAGPGLPMRALAFETPAIQSSASGSNPTGGLTFVAVPAESDSQEGSLAIASIGAPRGEATGRDALGALRVFVVSGGIHLPAKAAATDGTTAVVVQ